MTSVSHIHDCETADHVLQGTNKALYMTNTLHDPVSGCVIESIMINALIRDKSFDSALAY